MIAIIDYDAGNIKSVEHALEHLGAEAIITRDADTILNADGVILPGVGSFGDAMDKLNRYNLIDVIHEVVNREIPFLGICLGLQLLFEESEESEGVKGLGLLKGRIVRIPDEPGKKIPHIGWNDLTFPKGTAGTLFDQLPEHPYVYFVHSYYLNAAEDIVTATTEYGTTRIEAAVQKGRIYACQFHPEKSSEVGMSILRQFLGCVSKCGEQ